MLLIYITSVHDTIAYKRNQPLLMLSHRTWTLISWVKVLCLTHLNTHLQKQTFLVLYIVGHLMRWEWQQAVYRSLRVSLHAEKWWVRSENGFVTSKHLPILPLCVRQVARRWKAALFHDRFMTKTKDELLLFMDLVHCLCTSVWCQMTVTHPPLKCHCNMGAMSVAAPEMFHKENLGMDCL